MKGMSSASSLRPFAWNTLTPMIINKLRPIWVIWKTRRHFELNLDWKCQKRCKHTHTHHTPRALGSASRYFFFLCSFLWKVTDTSGLWDRPIPSTTTSSSRKHKNCMVSQPNNKRNLMSILQLCLWICSKYSSTTTILLLLEEYLFIW